MNVETFHFLLTAEGGRLLEKAARLLVDERARLRALSALRQEYQPDVAAAAVETILLRRRARKKFSRADQMFFTKESLEQASGETVSSYRARRYDGFEKVADMACGIGGDLIHLARLVSVVAVDSDPLRLEMARENAKVYGVAERIEFRLADIEQMELPDVRAVWFDPSRRVEGRRRVSLSEYSPPVTKMLDRWLPRVGAVGVKVSPAIPYDEIPEGCEVEFISEDWELKEAVLWFGRLRTAQRRATALPSQETLTDEPTEKVPAREPGRFLFEPDPAVIRAHLVEQLAARLGAWKLEERTAYLSSDQLTASPLVRAYRVHQAIPFNLKKLNEALRAMGAGRVTIKRRASPVDPREIEKKLKLAGQEDVVVVLTRSAGRPVALICQFLGPPRQQEAETRDSRGA